jgi:hypothetical protein
LYKLIGVADPPLVEDKIVRSVKAKTPHTEPINVKNWLGKPQRFKSDGRNGTSDDVGSRLMLVGATLRCR